MGFKSAFPGSYSRESIYTVNPVEEEEGGECCADCCRPHRRTKKSVMIGILVTLACITIVVAVLLFIYFVLDDIDLVGTGRKAGKHSSDDDANFTSTTMKEIDWNTTLHYDEKSEGDVKFLDTTVKPLSSSTEPAWRVTDAISYSPTAPDQEITYDDFTTATAEGSTSSSSGPYVPEESSFSERMSSTEEYSLETTQPFETTEVPQVTEVPPLKNVTNRACGVDEFFCTDGSACIPFELVCDTEAHCQDGSDEEGCTDIVCQENDFHCTGSGICIPPEWLCDSNRDCEDGSDELNCPSPACPSGQLLCFDGSCIELDHLCDGKNDCSDGGDEKNC